VNLRICFLSFPAAESAGPFLPFKIPSARDKMSDEVLLPWLNSYILLAALDPFVLDFFSPQYHALDVT